MEGDIKTFAELKEALDQGFNGGWWKESCKQAFLDAADLMCSESGLSPQDTYDLLEDLYHAVAGEFGD